MITEGRACKADGDVAEERVLFSTVGLLTDEMHAMYDVLPNGQGFLFARIEGDARGAIVVIQNWRGAVEQARRP